MKVLISGKYYSFILWLYLLLPYYSWKSVIIKMENKKWISTLSLHLDIYFDPFSLYLRRTCQVCYAISLILSSVAWMLFGSPFNEDSNYTFLRFFFFILFFNVTYWISYNFLFPFLRDHIFMHFSEDEKPFFLK